MTAPTDTIAAPDANSILMGGGGAPALRLDQNQGVFMGGRIVARPTPRQEREYNRQTGRSDGPPKTFPSGDPIWGILVHVQTSERNPQYDNDTGVRRIYVEGKRLKDAIREAVQAAGAPGLEVGGELYVCFTGLGQAAGPGVSPPKEYAAKYVPAATAALNTTAQPQAPVQQQALDTWAAQQTVQQNPGGLQQFAPQQPPAPAQQAYAAPVQQQPVAQPPAAPPAPGQPNAEQLAAIRAAGLDPATLFPGYQPA